jgi:RHS repeat-associated protein
MNEYYPFGLVNQQTSSKQFGSKENLFKYNGKELMNDFKLESYEYGARMYNPQIGRWQVVDKMSQKHQTLTPYHYAANNPVKFIDEDGNDFDYGKLSNAQRIIYFNHVTTLREASPMFNYIYSRLEASKNVFVVQFGDVMEGAGASFSASKGGGGSITYRDGSSLNQTYTLEENFHAFQSEVQDKLYPNLSSSNKEFEAKVFNNLALVEGEQMYSYQQGTESFMMAMQSKYNYSNPTLSDIQSKDFGDSYKLGLKSFVKYWRDNVKDPNRFSGYKANPSANGPNALMKVVQEAGAKNLASPRQSNGDYYQEGYSMSQSHGWPAGWTSGSGQ